MKHHVSVLAAFLLLAILQVCTAFKPPSVKDGDYLLKLEDNLFLGLRDQEPSSPVYLLDHPPRLPVWEVKNDDTSGTLTIQNIETGLYLSYNRGNLYEPLKVTTEKSMFYFSKVDENYVILPAILMMPPLAVTKLPPSMPGSPSMVGLREACKDPEQKWTLEPLHRLDDSPRQYRYPFHRLRFW